MKNMQTRTAIALLMGILNNVTCAENQLLAISPVVKLNTKSRSVNFRQKSFVLPKPKRLTLKTIIGNLWRKTITKTVKRKLKFGFFKKLSLLKIAGVSGGIAALMGGIIVCHHINQSSRPNIALGGALLPIRSTNPPTSNPLATTSPAVALTSALRETTNNPVDSTTTGHAEPTAQVTSDTPTPLSPHTPQARPYPKPTPILARVMTAAPTALETNNDTAQDTGAGQEELTLSTQGTAEPLTPTSGAMVLSTQQPTTWELLANLLTAVDNLESTALLRRKMLEATAKVHPDRNQDPAATEIMQCLNQYLALLAEQQLAATTSSQGPTATALAICERATAQATSAAPTPQSPPQSQFTPQATIATAPTTIWVSPTPIAPASNASASADVSTMASNNASARSMPTLSPDQNSQLNTAKVAYEQAQKTHLEATKHLGLVAQKAVIAINELEITYQSLESATTAAGQSTPRFFIQTNATPQAHQTAQAALSETQEQYDAAQACAIAAAEAWVMAINAEGQAANQLAAAGDSYRKTRHNAYKLAIKTAQRLAADQLVGPTRKTVRSS